MKKWNILDLVGEACITIEDGEIVYDLIHRELKTGRPVELDFAGVTVFAAPFFNAAFGQLLEDLTSDDLNQLLKVVNLIPLGMEAIKLVIKDSAQYYGDPAFRKAVDEVIMQQSENL